MYRTEIQTASIDVYGVVCDTYQQALAVAAAAVTSPNGTDTVAEVFAGETDLSGTVQVWHSVARMERLPDWL